MLFWFKVHPGGGRGTDPGEHRGQTDGFQGPNTNAFVERFIQTIQHEYLDHFLVFGKSHLNLLAKEFLEHYHTERPHQAVENQLLVVPKTKRRRKAKLPDTISLADIRCEQKLGVLLKSYKLAGWILHSNDVANSGNRYRIDDQAVAPGRPGSRRLLSEYRTKGARIAPLFRHVWNGGSDLPEVWQPI
jgi:hypothetical protein